MKKFLKFLSTEIFSKNLVFLPLFKRYFSFDATIANQFQNMLRKPYPRKYVLLVLETPSEINRIKDRIIW